MYNNDIHIYIYIYIMYIYIYIYSFRGVAPDGSPDFPASARAADYVEGLSTNKRLVLIIT